MTKLFILMKKSLLITHVFLLLFLAMMMEKEKQAWIGMSDTATKGGFQFVDGTPYVYSDWSFESYEWLYAHPNDARSKCITSSKDGWNYKECSDKLPSICRSRPNGVMSFALDLYFPGSCLLYTSPSPRDRG